MGRNKMLAQMINKVTFGEDSLTYYTDANG